MIRSNISSSNECVRALEDQSTATQCIDRPTVYCISWESDSSVEEPYSLKEAEALLLVYLSLNELEPLLVLLLTAGADCFAADSVREYFALNFSTICSRASAWSGPAFEPLGTDIGTIQGNPNLTTAVPATVLMGEYGVLV